MARSRAVRLVKDDILFGYKVFSVLYTPAGLIFSKSRVRGYGRLGSGFRDHRELELLVKLDGAGDGLDGCN